MDDILSHRLHFPRIRVSADSGTWTESNLHYVFTYLNMRKTWKCHETMERVLNFQVSSRSQESLFVFQLSDSWKRVGSSTFLSIYYELNKFYSGSLFIAIWKIVRQHFFQWDPSCPFSIWNNQRPPWTFGKGTIQQSKCPILWGRSCNNCVAKGFR